MGAVWHRRTIRIYVRFNRSNRPLSLPGTCRRATIPHHIGNRRNHLVDPQRGCRWRRALICLKVPHRGCLRVRDPHNQTAQQQKGKHQPNSRVPPSVGSIVGGVMRVHVFQNRPFEARKAISFVEQEQPDELAVSAQLSTTRLNHLFPLIDLRSLDFPACIRGRMIRNLR
ncbi:hypothetical protein K227x_28290 [Rubripirellula lacrimiformis]|uniref:Uncharacterized protein n=1 Tax=Rubripirellula lacrimiformis TaxID=1930273 RepID=A0A517NBQ5_9BACT|nr:hypothetical protein K227x_28290 [Rubripirellula lacrimiformis]